MAEFFADTDGVILYYAEDDNLVGLEPANADATDAYALVENNNADSATVNAKGFMTEFGLTPTQTTHYEAQWDDQISVVYIDLDKPVKTYGGQTTGSQPRSASENSETTSSSSSNILEEIEEELTTGIGESLDKTE